MKNGLKYFLQLVLLAFIGACSPHNELYTYQIGSYQISIPQNWRFENQNTIDGGSTKIVLPSSHEVYLTSGGLSRTFVDRFPEDGELFVDSLTRGEFRIYSRMSSHVCTWLEFYVERNGDDEDVMQILAIGLNFEEEGLLFSVLRTIKFAKNL